MEWLVIYLFVMIEKVGSFFALGWILMTVGLLGLGFLLFCVGVFSADSGKSFSAEWNTPTMKSFKGILKACVVVGLIAGSISYWIPDQKSMAIIAGTGITYKAVTSETGQRLGGKAISLLEQKIDAALGDTPDPKAPTKPAKAPVVEGRAL